jgi:hypothetical protein
MLTLSLNHKTMLEIPNILMLLIVFVIGYLFFGKSEEPIKKQYTTKDFTTLCKRSGCHNTTTPNSYNEGFCNRCADDAFFDM